MYIYKNISPITSQNENISGERIKEILYTHFILHKSFQSAFPFII